MVGFKIWNNTEEFALVEYTTATEIEQAQAIQDLLLSHIQTGLKMTIKNNVFFENNKF